MEIETILGLALGGLILFGVKSCEDHRCRPQSIKIINEQNSPKYILVEQCRGKRYYFTKGKDERYIFLGPKFPYDKIYGRVENEN